MSKVLFLSHTTNDKVILLVSISFFVRTTSELADDIDLQRHIEYVQH